MNHSYEDNGLLIKQLINGDEDAYVFLVNHFHKQLFAYALSLTNDYAMSQDIVQNVFLRTWEYREKLNATLTLRNFLYKSTYNEFIDQYRRNQSISNLEKAYVEALRDIVEGDNHSLVERKIEIISKEIEKLPKKCKRTFLLSKKEGLTNIEVAEFLNISVKTVEAQITKAYSLLRKASSGKLKMILFLMLKKKKKMVT